MERSGGWTRIAGASLRERGLGVEMSPGADLPVACLDALQTRLRQPHRGESSLCDQGRGLARAQLRRVHQCSSP